MKKFHRLKLAKKESVYKHKFFTSSQKEYELLIDLKSKGFLINVIKSIEYSVSQYLIKKNLSYTINEINIDGANVIVDVCKKDVFDTIIIPKNELGTGNHVYEFSIGCSEYPKLVDKDKDMKIFQHSDKKHVLYIET